MNIIRKILIAILSLIGVNLIFLFTLSINIKNVIVNSVIKETIKTNIVENIKETPIEGIDNEKLKEALNDPRIQDILESPEVEQIITNYLDTTIEGLIDPNTIQNINLEKDFEKIIYKSKDVLEDKLGKEISEELINETLDNMKYNDITNSFKQKIETTNKQMDEKTILALKIFNYIKSKEFQKILFIIILINIFLIALIEWSLYKWIKTLGKMLIISGIGIILAGIASSYIVTEITKTNSLNINRLLITGIIMFIYGLVSVIIYKIVLNIIGDRRNKNEISQVSI